MKLTKTRLKQIIKEELQLAISEAELAPTSTRPFCVGYVKEEGGKRTYKTVRAGSAGAAETKVKSEHKLSDKHIKSSHEGKCDSEDNLKRQKEAGK